MPSTFGLSLPALLVVAVLPTALVAQQFDPDAEPIRYRETLPDNAISRLKVSVAAEKTVLKHSDNQGYLPSLLEILDVPVSSQMLVFSKTSLQRDRISPRTPRAYTSTTTCMLDGASTVNTSSCRQLTRDSGQCITRSISPSRKFQRSPARSTIAPCATPLRETTKAFPVILSALCRQEQTVFRT